jgi:DNA-directed RNA polymerase subunit K/omega
MSKMNDEELMNGGESEYESEIDESEGDESEIDEEVVAGVADAGPVASEAGDEATSEAGDEAASEAEEDEEDEAEEEDTASEIDSEAEEEQLQEGGGNKSKKKKMRGGATLEAEEDTSSSSSGEGESSSDEEEDYLQKFNQSMREDLISNFHPESKSHNYEEIKQLAKVTRNKNGIVVDELHKTIPMLTKYEKTRILGQRAKQIESGAVTLVQVPPNIIDSYLIAKLELAQNKIPFIIRRPLPNGGMEYWYVSDLENL